MKTKTKKTVKKPIIKKTAVSSGSSRKVVKKVASKKKTVAKKRPSILKKPVKKSKLLGLMAIILGAFGVSYLAIAAFPQLMMQFTDDEPVLGVSTSIPYVQKLTASLVNGYSVKISWLNTAPSSKYNYLLYYYDKSAKKYRPAVRVSSAITEPSRRYYATRVTRKLVTIYIDQVPGEMAFYRAAMCYGECRFNIQDSQVTYIDPVGGMSSIASLNVPQIATPVIQKAYSTSAGAFISWNGIKGVDGYNVYRSTAETGVYAKVGSVGIPGTYSARHTENADGTLDIAENVISPTEFTDKTAIPGKAYFYKVSATKMIAPIVSVGGWQNIESASSSAKKVTIGKIAAPTNFTAWAPSSTSITIQYKPGYGMTGGYLYCNKCYPTKISLNLKNSSNIIRSTTSSNGFVSYTITGLKPGTEYKLQATTTKLIGGVRVESEKTSLVYVTTKKI